MQKSTLQERPWSEHEKLVLLAEILKLSPVPAQALAKLIRDFDVNPRWEDIPLPEGRSLNASKVAFFEINRHAGYHLPQIPNSYSQQTPDTRVATAAIARKRPFPGVDTLTPCFTAIQPKPPGLSPTPFTPVLAETSGSMRPSPGDPVGEPPKKRRGRPSNARIEQEKAAAAAEGREWQPRPSRAPRKKKNKPSGEFTSASGEAGPLHQSVPQTPETQLEEGHEATASGTKLHQPLRVEPAIVRTAPYDPIRQSPSQIPSVAAKTSPVMTEPQRPPQREVTLPATSEIHSRHESTLT